MTDFEINLFALLSGVLLGLIFLHLKLSWDERQNRKRRHKREVAHTAWLASPEYAQGQREFMQSLIELEISARAVREYSGVMHE